MRVVINGIVYNPDETPICILFEDDLELRHVAYNIKNMPYKDGVRAYLEYNESVISMQYARELIEHNASIAYKENIKRDLLL